MQQHTLCSIKKYLIWKCNFNHNNKVQFLHQNYIWKNHFNQFRVTIFAKTTKSVKHYLFCTRRNFKQKICDACSYNKWNFLRISKWNSLFWFTVSNMYVLGLHSGTPSYLAKFFIASLQTYSICPIYWNTLAISMLLCKENAGAILKPLLISNE